MIMGVDASIPLQVQPLKVPDPLQSYGRLVSIQNAQAQNNLANLQGQAAQVKLDENAAYKSALADTSNYDANGNLSTEGIQNVLKVAPTEGRALLQLQRQNRLTDAQIGYYGARTQKDQVDTQQAQHQAALKDTYDGLQQAKSGDLQGALTTFNRNLPKDQQATKLEYITDDNGKPVGLRAYLPDGTTHDTPDFNGAISTYQNLLAKPDTLITTQAANERADKQNAVTVRGQDVSAAAGIQKAKITAGGRVDAATVSASKPHIETLSTGQMVSVDPITHQATTITDTSGAPIIGKTPVGPDIYNAKIDAAKAYIAAHPRMIPDQNNPGQMKKNPDVLMNPQYDNIERMAGMQYIRKPGGNVDTVTNPLQQAPQSAIDFLKRNPKLAPQFKQKYGYLPKGF
jgi:hypothetical protein